MSKGKEIRMSPKEIEELLRLKKWSRRDLADAIGVKENIVARWLMAKTDRTPGAGTSSLMRLWLREARGEIRIVECASPAPSTSTPAAQSVPA